MRSLLIVAHGSRRAASNDEVRRLSQRMAQEAGDRFGVVACAFLELADPSIPAGIEFCIEQGAKEVVVAPYFLSAGRHVVEDIPREVDSIRPAHPNVEIRLVEHLGQSSGISFLLLDLAGNK